jgi:anthranilate synthase/aminodeoxychorismate synthase-like glutamine amidotransferase
MHGKTTRIRHRGSDVFQGLENPLEVMRYHSLVVSPDGLPKSLEVTAWSDDRPEGSELMAMRLRDRPLYGVQFHPESIATSMGKQLIRNFLALSMAG